MICHMLSYRMRGVVEETDPIEQALFGVSTGGLLGLDQEVGEVTTEDPVSTAESESSAFARSAAEERRKRRRRLTTRDRGTLTLAPRARLTPG